MGRGIGRGRVVALTYLLTEKVVPTISCLTDCSTDKMTHTGQGVGVGCQHSLIF